MTIKHLDTAELETAYRTGEGASSLARRYGVSVWSIITRLRAAGVEIRKNQNERVLGKPSTSAFSYGEIVDGLLLGDGNIDPKGLLHLEQSKVRYGWLESVKSLMEETGGTSKLIPIPPRDRFLKKENRVIHGKGGHVLYTPAYTFLQQQRRRWYVEQKPKAVKFIPKDLVITPMVAAQWFNGDGTYNTNGVLNFCTNGFTSEDVDFLASCVTRDLGVRATRGFTGREDQFLVNILYRNEAVKLRDLMLPWIPECCQYKLRFVRISEDGQLLPEQVLEIRKRAVEGEDHASLAVEFARSKQSIGLLIRGKTYKRFLTDAGEINDGDDVPG